MPRNRWPEPRPYPWHALESIDRLAARRAGQARRLVERAIQLSEIEQALGSTLGCEASVVVHGIAADDSALRLPSARVQLELVDGSGSLVVGVDPALATAAISRVLGRRPELEAPGQGLEPRLSGAFAAIVLEVARRSSHRLAVRSGPGTEVPCRQGISVRASVLLGDRAYEAGAWFGSPSLWSAPQEDLASDLASWGMLPVSLPMVCGLSVATRDELQSLRIGDAWSCGSGWMIDLRGCGTPALAAPTSDFGIAVECASEGRIVLRGSRVALPFDLEQEAAMGETTGEKPAELADAVLEAPIVVRVEVGVVTMAVRDWLRLRPGDVIETGARLAEPVVLRVAGREVARGELVDLEGELGVRIRELLTEGNLG